MVCGATVHCDALLPIGKDPEDADHLNLAAAKLNHRPRRVLGWITPAEAFDRVQHHTALLASASPTRLWAASMAT